MTNRNPWTSALLLGGLWAAVMGLGMLGMNAGCQGQGKKTSASHGAKSGARSGPGKMSGGGHEEGHHHMAGGHGTMQGGHGEADARSGNRPPSIFDSPPPEGTKAFCPVMKKTFFVSKTSPRTKYKGKWVYFCCSSCKGKFEANPEAYLK